MEAPTSSIFSELYLQHLENTVVFQILVRHKTVGHFRYVDDILIICNDNNTDIHEVLVLFNNVSLTISFTIQIEKENSINFLDITILRDDSFCSIYTGNLPLQSPLCLTTPTTHPNIRYQLSNIQSIDSRTTPSVTHINTQNILQ